MKPIVAIIGRPNVGKSTFFNRITKSRDALVENFPGVTRDRIYGDASWNDLEFTLIDTGGFTEASDNFAPQIRWQVQQAMEDADVVLFMLDGKGGISPFDQDIAKLMRASTKPVMVVVNKIDGPEKEKGIYDFYSLGIEDPFPVSAEHGYGMHDFLDSLVERLSRIQPLNAGSPEEEVVKIAVVGRPNVGKSSLINMILGEDRLLVSNMPGTTRDAVDSEYRRDGRLYRFIDTAGIRRKGKVHEKLEKISVIKALRSLDRCDVALMVLDAADGITEQDINIAGYAYDRGCGCIFLLNKWDLVEKDSNTAKKFQEQVKEAAKFLNFAPVMTISALTGTRVSTIFDRVNSVYSQFDTRVGTGQLNRIVEKATQKNEPSLFRGKTAEILLCHPDYNQTAHVRVLCQLSPGGSFFIQAVSDESDPRRNRS